MHPSAYMFATTALTPVFLLAAKPGDWDGAGMGEGLAAVEPGPPR